MPPSLTSLPFNWTDVLLAAVAALSLWRGWQAGFLVGALQLTCLFGGLLAAYFGTPPLAAAIAEAGWLAEPWASPVVFVLIFLIVQLLPALRTPDTTVAGRTARAIDKTLGLLTGAVHGVVNAMLVAALLTSLPLGRYGAEAVRDSRIASRLDPAIEWVQQRLAPIFDPALERSLQTLTEEPESGQTITLPFAVARTSDRPRLEAEMLVLVNAERARAGVRALVADPETVEVSRDHSRDMFARGYFSHRTPEGASPFDRLRKSGIGFRAAGENLALAPNLERAHQGLMDSPGHRANILNPAFGRLGIGIVEGGRHGLMVTQTFRN